MPYSVVVWDGVIREGKRRVKVLQDSARRRFEELARRYNLSFRWFQRYGYSVFSSFSTLEDAVKFMNNFEIATVRREI